MKLIMPDWPVPSAVMSFSTELTGGTSVAPYDDGTGGGGLNLGTHVGDNPECVRENRARLVKHLPAEPVWLNQVHSNKVVCADKVVDVVDADASYTTKPGCVCVIMTADCLPVLMCTTDAKVVAAAHGGWRGLASGILENTVEAIREQSTAPIVAWMGPAIGPNAFEVGVDVYDAFVKDNVAYQRAFVSKDPSNGKYLADIYMLARMRLSDIGVDQVFGGGFCTMTQKSRFYSYRRQSVTGRMATGIWIAQ